MENTKDKIDNNVPTAGNTPQAPPEPDVPTPAQASQTVYPAAPQPQTTPSSDSPYIGLTGSAMQEQKPPMPKGIYVISGLTVLGFVVNFFNTSSAYDFLYLLAAFINLLLVVGLLLRKDIARKALVAFATLSIVLASLNAAVMGMVRYRVHDSSVRYQNAIREYRNDPARREQMRAFERLEAQMAAREQELDRLLIGLAIRTGIALSLNAAIIIYLTRPRIKEYFS